MPGELSTRQPGDPSVSVERSLALAIALPPVVVGLTAAARLTVPATFCHYFSLTTLVGAGILSYIGGSWMILRRVLRAKARWGLTLVLYDLAMPVLMVGLAFLADFCVPCR